MEEGDEDNKVSVAIGGRRRAGWRDDVTPATSARKSKRAPVDSRGHRQGWLWMCLEDAATGGPRHSWRDQRRCQRG